MILDLYSLELSTLYKMQADMEEHLAELRSKEPFLNGKTNVNIKFGSCSAMPILMIWEKSGMRFHSRRQRENNPCYIRSEGQIPTSG